MVCLENILRVVETSADAGNHSQHQHRLDSSMARNSWKCDLMFSADTVTEKGSEIPSKSHESTPLTGTACFVLSEHRAE
jgi:hypothetical protein